MKDWIEPFRPVRPRTVRQETTKDKAGTLPIALYMNDKRANVAEEIALDAEESDESSHEDEPDEYDSDTNESDADE